MASKRKFTAPRRRNQRFILHNDDDDSPASMIVSWEVFDPDYEAHMKRVHAELSEQSRMFNEDLDSEGNEEMSEGNVGMSIFVGNVFDRSLNKRYSYQRNEGHQQRVILHEKDDESGAIASTLGSSGIVSLNDTAASRRSNPEQNSDFKRIPENNCSTCHKCTVQPTLTENELDRHCSDECGAIASTLGSSGIVSLKDPAASRRRNPKQESNFKGLHDDKCSTRLISGPEARRIESQKKYRGSLLAKVGERRRQQREYKLFLLAEALFGDPNAFQELYYREKETNYTAFEQLARAPVENNAIRRLSVSIPWPHDSEILAALKGGTIQPLKETGDKARQKRRSIVATIGELFIRHRDIFSRWLETRNVYVDFKLLFKLSHLPVTPEKLTGVPWPNNTSPIPPAYVLGCVCPSCIPITQGNICAEYAHMKTTGEDRASGFT